MNVACISDTHGFEIDIPECDILLHAGDMTGLGTTKQLERFLDWFQYIPVKHKIAIPGNHDFGTQNNVEMWKKSFADAGCTLLIEEAITVAGKVIYGCPWTPWFNDWAWNFPPDDDGKFAKETWNKIPSNTNILMTHGPPYKILDRVAHTYGREDPHVGCPYLADRISKLTNLELHVFGHIHEARGKRKVSDVLYVNASTCTLQYKPINPVLSVEL